MPHNSSGEGRSGGEGGRRGGERHSGQMAWWRGRMAVAALERGGERGRRPVGSGGERHGGVVALAHARGGERCGSVVVLERVRLCGRDGGAVNEEERGRAQS